VFAGRSGTTTICEHCQELTPGLLEFKATECLCRLRWFSHVLATITSAPFMMGEEVTTFYHFSSQGPSIRTLSLKFIHK